MNKYALLNYYKDCMKVAIEYGLWEKAHDNLEEVQELQVQIDEENEAGKDMLDKLARERSVL